MQFDDTSIRMLQLRAEGYYCSQILLILGLEAQGRTNPDLVRSQGGLAGGLGFTGHICGALTGGACLLGLYAGRGTDEEQEDPNFHEMVRDLVEWFNDEFGHQYGGNTCDQILEGNPANKAVRCGPIVQAVYNKVQEILDQYDIDIQKTS